MLSGLAQVFRPSRLADCEAWRPPRRSLSEALGPRRERKRGSDLRAVAHQSRLPERTSADLRRRVQKKDDGIPCSMK